MRGSPATRSTSFASPTELDALTSTASPGRTHARSSASVASSTLATRSSATLPTERCSASGAHLLADQDQPVDVRVEHRRREAGVERVAVLAELAHRAEHRDAARRRRVSAPRLFSVAAIDAGLAL